MYGDDDDYDDFIAGVDINNPPDPPDPPAANVDETQNNNDDSSVEDDDDTEGIPENENEGDEISENEISENNDDETPIVPIKLKNLTDHIGTLPPVIRSWTRQQPQETGESLITGANTEDCETFKTDTKKQRKLKKELQAQLLKRAEQENKKKIRNKLKKEKKKIKLKTNKTEARPIPPQVETINEDYEDYEDSEAPDSKEGSEGFGDLRDQLRSEQKPGVIFPHDSCSSKDLTPDLEAIALTQYIPWNGGSRNLVLTASMPSGKRWDSFIPIKWPNLWTAMNSLELKSRHHYGTSRSWPRNDVVELKHMDVLTAANNEKLPTRKMRQPLLSQLNPSCC
jgi:hypothetical protein